MSCSFFLSYPQFVQINNSGIPLHQSPDALNMFPPNYQVIYISLYDIVVIRGFYFSKKKDTVISKRFNFNALGLIFWKILDRDSK